MSAIVAFLARLGLSQRAAQLVAPFAAALAVTALLAALWGGWQAFDWFNDRDAVKDDRAASNADFRGRQIESERQAGAAKDSRDAGVRAKQDELEGKVNDADAAGDSAADDAWNGGMWNQP